MQRGEEAGEATVVLLASSSIRSAESNDWFVDGGERGLRVVAHLRKVAVHYDVRFTAASLSTYLGEDEAQQGGFSCHADP